MRTIVGDPSIIGAFFFGNTVQQDRQFSQQQERNWLSQGVSTFVSAFNDKARQVQEAFTSSAAEQLISNALNNVRGLFRPDIIYRFDEVRDMQVARSQMQAYIMAEPGLRALYHQNLVDGYSDTYVDPAPGVIGDGHMEYERVMNGVVQFTDDGYVVKHYSSAFIDADNLALSSIEQTSLLSTWQHMRDIMENNPDVDFTNSWGGSR